MLKVLGPVHKLDGETTNNALSKQGFSPYAGRTYPTQVYWGDQHVHTGWSVDAGGFGATLGPEEALRFALAKKSLKHGCACEALAPSGLGRHFRSLGYGGIDLLDSRRRSCFYEESYD